MRLWEKVRNLKISSFLRIPAAARLQATVGTVVHTVTPADLAGISTSSKLVTHTATGAITQDLHNNKINLLGEVGGDAIVTLTLPPATGSGAIYKFVVSVVNTSSYVIQVTTDDTIGGGIMSLADGGDTVVGFEADGTDDTITLNGTTKGGAAIGDTLTLIDIATDKWSVFGQTTSTGTEVTPFSAAVS